MDASAVDRLRAALAGTGWVDRAAALARTLRGAGHEPGGLLLVGPPDDEPWHLAAHLTDAARFGGMQQLEPTLVRWAPPPGAPPHLAVGLERLTAVRRGETLFVVTPAVSETLLEHVADARRDGATVLALDGSGDSELAALAHESLVVPGSGPPLEAVGHLVTAAAGAAPSRRRRLWR